MRNQAWNSEELALLAGMYRHMLVAQLNGDKVNKAALRRGLIAAGLSRSQGSIEAKLMNLSAAMESVGYPSLIVKGYKPAPNFQKALLEVARSIAADITANLHKEAISC